MQIPHALVLTLVFVACRTAQDEGEANARERDPSVSTARDDARAAPVANATFEAPVANGLLVRVVDARTHEPVPFAEVRAELAQTADGPDSPEVIFAGPLGRVDRYGRRWRCDEHGEVRIAPTALRQPIVASEGERWGCVSRQWHQLDGDASIVVALEKDETLRVECADEEGRPGVGSLVWVLARASETDADEPDDFWAWGARVDRADGSIGVPHAQMWRALAARGDDVRIAGFTFWDDRHADPSRPFPAEGPLRFEVATMGTIDVVLVDETGARTTGQCEAWFRWLDSPVEPGEERTEDDIPEVGNTLRDGRMTIPGVPLGHRYELAIPDVPGWIDPRIAFDGPKSHGEHVRVELAARVRAATIQGRLVDATGEPLAHHACEAWIEHEDMRIRAEGDSTYTDDEGRFTCDFAPLDAAKGAVFVLRATGATFGPMEGGGWGGRVVMGGAGPEPVRRALSGALTASVQDVGDVRCEVPDPEDD